jgi:hypothetical protein
LVNSFEKTADGGDAGFGKVGFCVEKFGLLSVVFFMKVVSVGGFLAFSESAKTSDFIGETASISEGGCKSGLPRFVKQDS